MGDLGIVFLCVCKVRAESKAMAKAKPGAVSGLPRALQIMYVAIILENDHAEYMDQGVCPQDPVSEEESE